MLVVALFCPSLPCPAQPGVGGMCQLLVSVTAGGQGPSFLMDKAFRNPAHPAKIKLCKLGQHYLFLFSDTPSSFKKVHFVTSQRVSGLHIPGSVQGVGGGLEQPALVKMWNEMDLSSLPAQTSSGI